MKETIRENITNVPYSLHDMYVTQIKIEGDRLVLHFENGFVKNQSPYEQVEGSVIFEGVDFDFGYVDVYHNRKKTSAGGNDTYIVKRFDIKTFVKNFRKGSFEVIDETWGYNKTRLEGWLLCDGHIKICTLAIYHAGDMKYQTEE